MAEDPTKSSGDPHITPDGILKDLGPLAGVLKQTAETLWSIFVRRYIAKGMAMLLGAVIITALSIRLLGTDTPWLFIPGIVVTVLLFDAIQLLVNPHYFAMDDMIAHLKNTDNKEVSRSGRL